MRARVIEPVTPHGPDDAVPFDERRAWAWTLGVAIAALGAATGVSMTRALAINGQLKSLCGFSIVDLELAGSPSRAALLIGTSPGGSCRALAETSIDQDWALIACYSLGLAAVGLFLMWALRSHRRSFAPILFGFPLLAGTLDAAENVALLGLLRSVGQPPVVLTALSASAAALKFILLDLVVAAIVVAIYRIFRTPSVDPCHVVGFDTVRAAERLWIKRRRELAGVPPALRDPEVAPPIGLAFSGGGIRSATFNLGVLQGLARLGVLGRFDYLSTVSGGGYIGACFTSLLSAMQRPDGTLIEARPDGYVRGGPLDGRPRFASGGPGFPLRADPSASRPRDGLDGLAQLRHLRTHGDFLIVRKQLLSRDVLRVVGTAVSAVVCHLLLFTLLLVAAAALYFAVVCWAAGDPTDELRGVTVREYAAKLVAGPPGAKVRDHPLLHAAIVGVGTSFASLVLVGWVIGRLDERWFQRPGRSVDDAREQISLWVVAVMTLATAAGVMWYYVARDGPRLSHLSLPLAVYVGGFVTTTTLQVLVMTHVPVGPNGRSRFAATKGIFDYLTAASVIVVAFPYVIYWLDAPHATARTGLGWLVALAGTRLLAGGRGSARPQVSGWVRWLRGATASLRNALLSVCLVVVLVLGALIICAWISAMQPGREVPPTVLPLALGLAALACFVGLGIVLNFNRLALHYFYRDRLAEAYLQTYATRPGRPDGPEARVRDDAVMPMTHLHGVVAQGSGVDVHAAATASPFHLVVTALNLTASRDMTRRDRKSDQFVFSKLYCGSETTGYVATREYRGGETKLARAVAISGAAASAAMGRNTSLAQSFALTLFAVRLGQWMENPRYRAGARAHRVEGGVFWPNYLFREMLGWTTANARLVNLSDGGHTGDNLGLYALLRRRCAVIVACDAEADPAYGCSSLAQVLRQVSIDELIEVDLDLNLLRPSPDSSRRHFAVGRIRYPASPTRPAEVGWLLVLKSSLTGDEGARIGNYCGEFPDFPQQSTADQFFDDDQFESYRELGEHVARTSLTTLSELAWAPTGTDWTTAWAQLATVAATPEPASV